MGADRALLTEGDRVMGGEIRVNSYQHNWQRNAYTTVLADGSFLVV